MKFSVLLCLYGNDSFEHFQDCYLSILNQHDGSFDEIVVIVEGKIDDKFYEFFTGNSNLRVYFIDKINGPFNFGFPSALNFGINVAKGDYIVRIDPDDICSPLRWKETNRFIRENPNIDLFSSHVGEYDERLKIRLGSRKVPISAESIRSVVKYRSPFNHPAVVFKRSSALLIGGYPQVPTNEDYCFWASFVKLGYVVGNIDKVLVSMRTGNDLIKRRTSKRYRKLEKYSMRYLWSLGVLNTMEFIVFTSLRYLIRLMPLNVVKVVYKIIRK